MTLTSRQVRALRARAHALQPTVWVGNGGLSEAVVAKVDAELDIHELIKVRIDAEEREDFRTMAQEAALQTKSSLVQTIGRIAVLHRPVRKPKKDADA